ncbi:hypothetical protein F6J64_02005 [Mycoplasmoides gallisepticum]|nr:hypothetical protein F6J64_02005 [Mycoplasmoides gallisepticum]
MTGYSLAADYSTYLAPYTRAIANVPNSAVTRRFLLVMWVVMIFVEGIITTGKTEQTLKKLQLALMIQEIIHSM